MGSRLFLSSCIAAWLLSATAPVLAQQTEPTQSSPPVFSLPPGNSSQPAAPQRQGPELDIFRNDTVPATPPPAITPTAPARTAPTPVPTPTRPERATRTTPRAAPVAPPSTRPEPEPASEPAPNPEPADRIPAPDPVDVGNGAGSAEAVNESAPPVAPAPEAAPVEPASPDRPWLWIAGALAALALAGLAVIRRRGKAAPVARGTTTPAVTPPPPPPSRPPSPPARPATPAPRAPDLAPAAPPTTPGRPWIDLHMTVTQARLSVMGLTVAYRLILHNRGDVPAGDLLVRGAIGNAGARQQVMLDGFFSGQDGLPLHSLVALDAGGTIALEGELRLPHDRIEPVAMGERALIVPLAAFDVAYRWGADDAKPNGQGRTARAFIVGQEQQPPADRLSPFRLDQGLRQYPRPAARAATELTPS